MGDPNRCGEMMQDFAAQAVHAPQGSLLVREHRSSVYPVILGKSNFVIPIICLLAGAPSKSCLQIEMTSDLNSLLDRRRLPGRVDAAGAAEILGFNEPHITLLVSAKLLKPLGRPNANSRKFFASSTLLDLSRSAEWLNKATICVDLFMKNKYRKQQARKDAQIERVYSD